MDISQRKGAKPEAAPEQGGGGSHTLAGLVNTRALRPSIPSPILLTFRRAAAGCSPSGHAVMESRSQISLQQETAPSFPPFMPRPHKRPTPSTTECAKLAYQRPQSAILHMMNPTTQPHKTYPRLTQGILDLHWKSPESGNLWHT